MNALNQARHEARDRGTDHLPVSLQKLSEDVAELQEELRLTEAEAQKKALAAGHGILPGLSESGRRWMPKGVWLPADLTRAEEDDVRNANILFKQKVDELKGKGEEGTELFACVYKTWRELGADLKRRLHATKDFKKAAKAEAKRNALDARQQRAIDDFDNWEKILLSVSDRKWWHEEGYYRAMNKHFPNANIFKPAEPDEVTPINEAQVETEEL